MNLLGLEVNSNLDSKERDRDLIRRMLNCSGCPWKERKCQTVLPEGSVDAQLMIVGRSPGVDEDREGLPFIGKGGKYLDKFLEAAKVKRSKTRITNLAHCYGGPGDPPPTEDVYDACQPLLEEEIQIVKPKMVLLLGNDTFRRVLKYKESCTKYQGQVITPEDRKLNFFIASHPGYWCRQPKYFQETIIADTAVKFNEALYKYEVDCF